MSGLATDWQSIADANHRLNDREYRKRKTHLESFPYHVQIGTDNRCNLRCGFCLAEAYREAGVLHIQDRKLQRNPIARGNATSSIGTTLRS